MTFLLAPVDVHPCCLRIARDPRGENLVPTPVEERDAAERSRAEAERSRAEAERSRAEAEARLREAERRIAELEERAR